MASKLPGQGTSIFAIMSGLANEHKAINLSQGFPDFDSDPRLIELVHQHMVDGKNQYAPMPGVPELRSEIANKMNRLYGANISSDTEVTITAGATQAIFNILHAFIHSGDEVIVMEPAYDCYIPGIVLAGGIPRPVPFRAPEFEFPWDAVEKEINSKTRMILITNPHNPLGKIMKEEDVQRMQKIAKNNDILFLVDEVYEHLVYDQKDHLSILRYPDLYEKSIVTFSFGKTFHNTGWKMGYSIASKKLTEEIRKIHQFNVFSVNTPIQYALADYMSEIKSYQDLGAFFEKKRNLLQSGLMQTPLTPLHCEGSYFMLADYSKISQQKDLDFAKNLTINTGVATIPLSPFYSSNYNEKVVRICFAKKDSTIQSALNALGKVKGER